MPSGDKSPSVHSTCHIKWTSDERQDVFPKIHYLLLKQPRKAHWVPKINDDIETEILQKITKMPDTVKEFIKIRGGKNKIYYRHTGGLYWKLFTDFIPRFYGNNKPMTSNTQTSFSLIKESYVLPLIAILSSDVFWWYYTITSNLRDMPPYDINNFPISEKMLDSKILCNLGKEYMDDLIRNSEMMTRVQAKTGTTQTQAFKIIKSKHIINKIDIVLAKYYGFTEEEMDYIINYDYKYRMGGPDE